MSAPIQVALLTKPGCHLCDEMKDVLARATRGLPVEVSEVDISTDLALEERHGQDIPVLFIDGRKAFKHRVSERELRKRLEIADRR
jgi:glutaredoxin